MHWPARQHELRLTHVPRTVILTIDTEPDDAWADHRCTDVANVRALRRLATLLRRYGARPTLLVTYRVIQDAECVDVLRELVADAGAEIGAHLHPWETPPFMASGVDVRYPTYPHELPLQVFANKLTCLTEALAARLGQPTAYRAGRWGLCAAHVRVLENLGYTVDSSVMPLMDWRDKWGIPRREHGLGGQDYRDAPPTPYRLSYTDVTAPGAARLVEVPVTAGFTRPTPVWLQRAYVRLPLLAQRALRKLEVLRPVWATPAWETRRRLERLTRLWLRGTQPVMNLAFHSSEFVVNSLPDCDTPEKVDEVFRRTEAVLEILAAGGGCTFETLTSAARRWVLDGRPAPQTTNARPVRPARLEVVR